jgi:DNA-binding NtrC family response regulator
VDDFRAAGEQENMETDIPSILVIDDNERFRAVLGLLLEANSFRVRLATNPREALRYLKAELFSLVLTDFLLDARGDPERIARSLLEAASPVPVGCLTGWSNLPARISNQYAFVLHKPVPAENILGAIRSLLSPRDQNLHRYRR